MAKKIKLAAKRAVKTPKKDKPKTVKKAEVGAIKAPARKPQPKNAPPLKKTLRLQPVRKANEKILGEVEDYFAHINVIATTLKDNLELGEAVHVRGHTTDLLLKVESMQIDHKAVTKAKKGESVGILVSDRCRKGDRIFKAQ